MLYKTDDHELQQAVSNLLSALKYGSRVDAVKQFKILLGSDLKSAIEMLNDVVSNFDRLKSPQPAGTADAAAGQYVVVCEEVKPVSKPLAVLEARRTCMDHYNEGPVYIAKLVSRITIETKEEPVT